MKPNTDHLLFARGGHTEGSTHIRFLDGREGLLSVLEIEAPGDQNIIRSVYQALLSMRAQVVRVDYAGDGPRTRYRLHVVELDGAPISAGRRLEIQSGMIGLAGDLINNGRSSEPPPEAFIV